MGGRERAQEGGRKGGSGGQIRTRGREGRAPGLLCELLYRLSLLRLDCRHDCVCYCTLIVRFFPTHDNMMSEVSCSQ